MHYSGNDFSSTASGHSDPYSGQTNLSQTQPVECPDDLLKLRLSDRRIWMRIRDPNSNKRTLSQETLRMVDIYQSWFLHLQPLRPMRPKHFWSGESAADACAAGPSTQIGGSTRDSSGNCKWFSEKCSHSDFPNLKIDLVSDLQKWITCMETLAQLGILHVAARHFHATRMPIQLSSWTDILAQKLLQTNSFAQANLCATLWRNFVFFQPFQVLKWMFIMSQAMTIRKLMIFLA